jgi:hypothetical protein
VLGNKCAAFDTKCPRRRLRRSLRESGVPPPGGRGGGGADTQYRELHLELMVHSMGLAY